MVGVVVKTIQKHAIHPTICRVRTTFYTPLSCSYAATPHHESTLGVGERDELRNQIIFLDRSFIEKSLFPRLELQFQSPQKQKVVNRYKV
jgi:hypothetical protein